MKLKTLERYIKKTTIGYGDIVRLAQYKGLNVILHGNGVVDIADKQNHNMRLFFENDKVYKENKTSGLIATDYNYPKSCNC